MKINVDILPGDLSKEKEKQGELGVPRRERKLGQVNKTSGLLSGYFI